MIEIKKEHYYHIDRFLSCSIFSSSPAAITSMPISSASSIDQPDKTMQRRGGRTSDLLDGPREPLARRNNPEAHAVREHDAHRDDRVVERLRVDRVLRREDERDRDEADPRDRCDRDGVRERAEVERPAHEARAVHHAQRDRDRCAAGRVRVSPGVRGKAGGRAYRRRCTGRWWRCSSRRRTRRSCRDWAARG